VSGNEKIKVHYQTPGNPSDNNHHRKSATISDIDQQQQIVITSKSDQQQCLANLNSKPETYYVSKAFNYCKGLHHSDLIFAISSSTDYFMCPVCDHQSLINMSVMAI